MSNAPSSSPVQVLPELPDELTRVQNQELRAFLENAVVPMHWVGRDGTILWANHAELDLLGYSPAEYIGHHVAEFHADPEVIQDILQRLCSDEELHGAPSRLKCKDGSIRDVRIFGNVLRRDGQVIHTRCFTIDATAETAAAETRERMAAIVENSDDAIVSKDLNGIVTSWNPAAERMFGYKAEEIIGKSITLIIPPELLTDETLIIGKVVRGERLRHFETVRVTKSGERLNISLTVSPLRDATGKIVGATKVARDVTDLKRAEQALRRAEKLAATGQLAATIAHEINNPMQSLTNLLSLLTFKSSLDETARQLCIQADDQLRRMAHITRQMLSFYRETATPVPLKVTEVLEEVLEILLPKMNSNRIRVERQYNISETIYAFPVEMRQLFVNLLDNAIAAVDSGGRIAVRVESARELRAPGRRGIRIVIADNGCGIPAHVRHRIYEPFITTKAERGTGLGLWVAKGIVVQHDGHIQVRSSTSPRHHGTVFSIFLPSETAQSTLGISA
jgi:PAS domain S-box-containing protein